MSLQIEIVTPDRAVFADEAESVVVPGSEGEMEILSGHLQLLTTIHAGAMTVLTTSGETRKFFIDGGFAEVQPDRVTVLTGFCSGADEIDIAEAKRMVAEAEERYQKMQDSTESEQLTVDERDAYLSELDRARRRLAFSEEHTD